MPRFPPNPSWRPCLSNSSAELTIIMPLIFHDTNMHSSTSCPHNEKSEQRCRWRVVLRRHLLYEKILPLGERAGTNLSQKTVAASKKRPRYRV